MSFELRPYQLEAVETLFHDSGSRRVLCVMPTASGKTLCFLEILKRAPEKKTLIILNRVELFDQTMRNLREVFPHEKIREYCGSRRKQYHDAKFTIALIQSIVKTKASFKFDQVFLDEV